MKKIFLTFIFTSFLFFPLYAENTIEVVETDFIISEENHQSPSKNPDKASSAVPSVTMVGTAKMGLLHSNDNDEKTRKFSTIAEYSVEFNSKGVSDGGLIFGAGITIEGKDSCDKGMITDPCDKNSITNGSVYIGAENGSWKLQFGDNDPGTDIVPQIGLADVDEISSRTRKITSIPQIAFRDRPRDDGDRSVLIYRPNGLFGVQDKLIDSTQPNNTTEQPLTLRIFEDENQHKEVFTIEGSYNRDGGIWTTTSPPNRQHIGLSGTISSVQFRLTSGIGKKDENGQVEPKKGWSFGAGYKSEFIDLSAGFDSNKVIAFNSTSSFDGNVISLTFAKQSGQSYYAVVERERDYSNNVVEMGIPHYAHLVSVNNWNAFGVELSRDVGRDTNLSIAYSKLDDKNKNSWKLANQEEFSVVTKDETKIEFELEHDLGGGATLYSHFSRHDKENSDFVGEKYVSTNTTRLETGLKMSF